MFHTDSRDPCAGISRVDERRSRSASGLGDGGKARKLTADLTAAESRNDIAGAAKILDAIGALYYFDLPDYPRAVKVYQEALTDAKAAADLQLQASALNGIANSYRLQGESEQAILASLPKNLRRSWLLLKSRDYGDCHPIAHSSNVD